MGFKKAMNIDRTFVGFPGIEAIFDGFGLIFDCTTHLESAYKPALQIALPTVYRFRRKLAEIPEGKNV